MKNFVISIARGFGSGGKQIGLQLANELGVKFIDKELIQMASLESGISEEMFAQAEEKLRHRFLRFIPDRENYGNVLTPEDGKFVSDTNLFNYQVKILRMLAKTESFVIVGKAVNYVLRDYDNVVSVSIQAPFEDCVRTIMERSSMNKREAAQAIRRTDRYRSDYYKFYTGENWLDVTNFDLALNSSRVGWDGCVKLIRQYTADKLDIPL